MRPVQQAFDDGPDEADADDENAGDIEPIEPWVFACHYGNGYDWPVPP